MNNCQYWRRIIGLLAIFSIIASNLVLAQINPGVQLMPAPQSVRQQRQPAPSREPSPPPKTTETVFEEFSEELRRVFIKELPSGLFHGISEAVDKLKQQCQELNCDLKELMRRLGLAGRIEITANILNDFDNGLTEIEAGVSEVERAIGEIKNKRSLWYREVWDFLWGDTDVDRAKVVEGGFGQIKTQLIYLKEDVTEGKKIFLAGTLDEKEAEEILHKVISHLVKIVKLLELIERFGGVFTTEELDRIKESRQYLNQILKNLNYYKKIIPFIVTFQFPAGLEDLERLNKDLDQLLKDQPPKKKETPAGQFRQEIKNQLLKGQVRDTLGGAAVQQPEPNSKADALRKQIEEKLKDLRAREEANQHQQTQEFLKEIWRMTLEALKGAGIGAGATASAMINEAILKCKEAGQALLKCVQGQLKDQLVKIKGWEELVKNYQQLNKAMNVAIGTREEVAGMIDEGLSERGPLVTFFGLLINFEGARDKLVLSEDIIALLSGVIRDLYHSQIIFERLVKDIFVKSGPLVYNQKFRDWLEASENEWLLQLFLREYSLAQQDGKVTKEERDLMIRRAYLRYVADYLTLTFLDLENFLKTIRERVASIGWIDESRGTVTLTPEQESQIIDLIDKELRKLEEARKKIGAILKDKELLETIIKASRDPLGPIKILFPSPDPIVKPEVKKGELVPVWPPKRDNRHGHVEGGFLVPDDGRGEIRPGDMFRFTDGSGLLAVEENGKIKLYWIWAVEESANGSWMIDPQFMKVGDLLLTPQGKLVIIVEIGSDSREIKYRPYPEKIRSPSKRLWP